MTIVFAKRSAHAGRDAAQAGLDAVREQREMRVEDDHRRLADALWRVRLAADAARDTPGKIEAHHRLRDAQKALQTSLIMPLRVDLGPHQETRLNVVLDVGSSPQAVLGGALG